MNVSNEFRVIEDTVTSHHPKNLNDYVLTGSDGAFKGSEMMWIIPLEAIISHSTIALLSTYRILLCQEKKEWELSFDPSPFDTEIDIISLPQLLTPREKKYMGVSHCCLPGHQPGMAPGWSRFSCTWSSHHHHYLCAAFMLFCPFFFLFSLKVFVIFGKLPSSA